LGFLGFVVPTFKQTPFSSGLSFNCGDRSFRAFRSILPCRNTCIRVHLCARDEGAGRIANVGVAFWKARAAIEGRIERAEVSEKDGRADGRTKRRRNVRDMVGDVDGWRWSQWVDQSSRWKVVDD
jgi:hypothetical protein